MFPTCPQLLLTILWCVVVVGPMAYLFVQLFGQFEVDDAEWEMVCTGQVREKGRGK